MDQAIARISAYLSGCATSADFNPMAIAGALPNVYVLEIERDDGGAPKLLIKLMGTALETAFGRPLAGHYLESFIHGPRGADVIRGFHDCALTHEPLWMRQIVRMQKGGLRFVEGAVFYLAPERIYGGLSVGEWTHSEESSFERKPIARAVAPAIS